MQESFVGAWMHESQLALANLHSLQDLNRRFLELAVHARAAWTCQGEVPGHIVSRLAPLSQAQREAAANCPYAMFDLRFREASHWRERLFSTRWHVADGTDPDPATVDFVRMALFYAWHIARMPDFTAPLLLGMNSGTAEAFRGATMDCLSALAVTESAHLRARWSDCSVYWRALANAAGGDDPTMLRRVQLHGLQLAAATRLQSTREGV